MKELRLLLPGPIVTTGVAASCRNLSLKPETVVAFDEAAVVWVGQKPSQVAGAAALFAEPPSSTDAAP